MFGNGTGLIGHCQIAKAIHSHYMATKLLMAIQCALSVHRYNANNNVNTYVWDDFTKKYEKSSLEFGHVFPKRPP